MFSRRELWWFRFRYHRITLAVLRWINFQLRDWKCECCHSFRGVELESGRTAYHYEGPYDVFNDPNRAVGLCRGCAKDHHEHWDAMWDEYRYSQGY